MAANKARDEKIVNEKIVDFANRGFRALGIARCDDTVSTSAQHAVSSLIATASLLVDHLTKATDTDAADAGFGFALSISIGTADGRRVGYGWPATPVRSSPPRHQVDH